MSEFGKRVISGIVLIIVALGALVLGGWVWEALCAVVGLIVIVEWFSLARRFAGKTLSLWMIGAVIYIGGAVVALVLTRATHGVGTTATLLAAVWAVDIGAYFAGRALGGPKLAPRLSPNKTWSGLVGGAVGAFVVLMAYGLKHHAGAGAIPGALFGGLVVAILAQAGDLFESWMKRRAGAKDSGRIIPGHGGVFDRVDGLLAVAFVHGVVSFVIL